MAWMILYKASYCTNTSRKIYPDSKLVDALEKFDKQYGTWGANIQQWTEISLEDATILAKRWSKDETGYEWATKRKKP